MRLKVLVLLAALMIPLPALAGTDFALHRAIVESSHDPLRSARLLVNIPDLGGVTEWASPSVPYAADPRSIAVPPDGETVWVLFEGGDVSLPVWIGWRPDAPHVRPYDRHRP